MQRPFILFACLLLLALARKTAAAPVGPEGARLCHEGDSAQGFDSLHTSVREALRDSEPANAQPEADLLLQTASLARRAIVNIKAARPSSTITVAPNAPTDKAIPNPKDQHGRWPLNVKIVPIWTLNSTTIFGVKPTHPGRPTNWPPTGQPTPTPAA
ncbi:hypothetical protein B0A53_01711 [Rhodotorula sp. CCFEE 5036]|nr:hypothetical protein B0A53_01711 [Rhodotorula sp. CCFEE 5036]